MAALLLTKHWESDDSLSLLDETILTKPQENSQKKILVPVSPRNQINPPKQPPKQRSLNTTRRVTNHKAFKPYEDIILESSHVKASALLYEITERTNQLAQPRIREPEVKSLQPRTTVSQIPKASSRIIELSKPRAIHQRPSKPIGYISPGALTAIATQRILELSRPKKKRRLKLLKKRKVNRQMRNSGTLSKLCRRKSRCHTRQAKKVSNLDYGSFPQNKTDRRMKKKKISRRKQYLPKDTNSNKTIIMVDLKLRNKRKKTKSKKIRRGSLMVNEMTRVS